MVLALLGAALFWNFVVVNSEIQRHFSLLASIMVLIIVSLVLPLNWYELRKSDPRVVLKFCLVIVAIVTLRQIDVSKVPGYRDDAFPDYFCMNDIITHDHPNLPVVAAGIVNRYFPIAAEVTPALMPWRETIVHQRVTSQQSETLYRINRAGGAEANQAAIFPIMAKQIGAPIKSDLSSLGFRAVIWGPAEDRHWGEAVRKVLITSENLLARCGSVSLFTLTAGKIKESD
jgi:hypothetical protein